MPRDVAILANNLSAALFRRKRDAASCRRACSFLQLRGDQHLDRAGLEQCEHTPAAERGNQEPYHDPTAHAGPVSLFVTHSLLTSQLAGVFHCAGGFVASIG